MLMVLENGIAIILLLLTGTGVGYLFRPRRVVPSGTEILQKLTTALNASLTIEQVVEVIVNEGLMPFSSGTSSIYLLSEDRQSLKMVKLKAISEKSYQEYNSIPL